MRFRAESDFNFALGVMPLNPPVWFDYAPYGRRIDGIERKVRLSQDGRAKLRPKEVEKIVSQAVTDA